MTETMITVGETKLSVAELLALPRDVEGWRGAPNYPDRARGDAYLAILDADESR